MINATKWKAKQDGAKQKNPWLLWNSTPFRCAGRKDLCSRIRLMEELLSIIAAAKHSDEMGTVNTKGSQNGRFEHLTKPVRPRTITISWAP